jgi:CubicO group peptidase (beta-lactamase class C family)
MGALELVTWWPVDAAAGGVVRSTGSAGRESATVVDDVGDIERPFAWASMTKLLVTMAVLVAVEEGTISLDEPVGPPRSTVRHLLSHASGLGPDSPVPVAAPERMRIYSNIAFELLADALAQHAHMPFADYLAGGVLTPLHMTATALVPGSSPASGAQGPMKDLLALAAELLAPTIVSPATLAAATDVAFPGLRGVLPGYGRFDPCDWGLGFEVKGTKDPHWTGTRTTAETFGHFGRAGGFLWVDPVAGLACATLSNRDFGPWAVTEWSTLADAVVEEWNSLPAAVPLENSRNKREAEETEAERRAQEAAQAEVAQAERRAQEGARAEAAQAELRRREAAESERQRNRETARTAEEEAERSKRAAAKAERRDRQGSRASGANGGKRKRKAAEADLRVAAMAERRDEGVARVPDAKPAEARNDEVGPLGPGIRPADFWGG